MLARILGLVSKKTPAVPNATEQQDEILQARIRTFVKVSAIAAPALARPQDAELAAVVQEVPAFDDGGGNPDASRPTSGNTSRLSPLSEIYLTPEAMQSSDLSLPVQINIDIVNFLRHEAGLEPSEIAEAAVMAYYVDYYRAQVLRGGHSQFISASAHQSVTQDMCREGLVAMAAQPYLGLFQEMHLVMAREVRCGEALLAGNGLGKIDPAMKALDDHFLAADKIQPLQDIVGNWLRTRPELVVLEEAELGQRLAELARHPALQTRREAVEADRERARAADPLVILARKLCSAAGREWEDWGGYMPEHEMGGKTYRNVWCMMTDQGDAAMAESEPGKAVLFAVWEDEELVTVAAPGPLPWNPAKGL